jgi:trimethylamine--corrinoid protein Co-methyltransferase
MVHEALASAPKSFTLYDREGEPSCYLEGNNCYFNPGGCSLSWLEDDGVTSRESLAKDQIQIAQLTENLPFVRVQSCKLNMADIPNSVQDQYMTYISFLHCRKPMVGGYLNYGSLYELNRVLAAAVGGEKELAEKPRMLMDCTPSAPLKWSRLALATIWECSDVEMPIEFISVPMPGSVSPATLAGSVLLHTAELLAGITFTQAARIGQKLVYGSAPMYFDLKTMNPLLAGLESAMMFLGINQMGKFYGLPTHAYAGLSDSKLVDLQSGWEDSFTALLAVLGGINSLSGLSQLEFCLLVSPEKLVASNDLIGKFERLQRGIEVNENTLAARLIDQIGPGGEYISARHTLQNFRKEAYFPSDVVDRKTRREGDTPRTTFQRAKEKKEKILSEVLVEPNFSTRRDMDETITEIFKKHSVPLPKI